MHFHLTEINIKLRDQLMKYCSFPPPTQLLLVISFKLKKKKKDLTHLNC